MRYKGRSSDAMNFCGTSAATGTGWVKDVARLYTEGHGTGVLGTCNERLESWSSLGNGSGGRISAASPVRV